MTKKAILLIASAAMGTALVGGTFAAYYVVTDNADTKNVLVSPGSVNIDQSTVYATLSWGEGTNISAGVSNLEMDTYREAAVLDLRVNTSDTNSFKGKLDIVVSDRTVGKGTNEAKLIDNLDVKVYAGNLPDTNGVIAASALTGKTALTAAEMASLGVTSGEEHLYTVVVSLTAMNAATYAEIQDDLVNLAINWDKAAESDTQKYVTTTQFYATGFGGQTYVYAWKGSAANGEYPGVAMTSLGNDLYTCALDLTAYENVIFTNNLSGEAEKKSGDLAISAVFTEGKNLFTFTGNGTAKGDASIYTAEQAELDYYLVGDEFGNWNMMNEGAIKMTKADDHYTAVIKTKVKDSPFKIHEPTGNHWYGETQLDEGLNFVIEQPGDYTISFYPNKNADQKYIVCAQVVNG